MIESFKDAVRLYLTSQAEANIPVQLCKNTHARLSKREQLVELYHQHAQCTRCDLHTTRTNFVFGAGNADSSIVLIGEAPGFEEDQQGKPFVGPSGQLLTKMLAAINLDRSEDVFICNTLKCRPPGNRNPSEDELSNCSPLLQKQLSILEPKAILILGKVAAQVLLQRSDALRTMRGKAHTVFGVPALVTYHPSALLRNSSLKRDAWADLQEFQKMIQEEK